MYLHESDTEWKLHHLARLESKMVGKHLLLSLSTAKGHLDQERKNLQSTKTVSTQHISTMEDNTNTEEDNDFFPHHQKKMKQHMMFVPF